MTATSTFYDWFLRDGLSDLGGWFIFLLIALAATIWLFYNSASRRLPAMGWKLSITLATILVFPSGLYRFTVNDITDVATSPLGPFGEPIFYMGVLGGILSVMLAIGYYITFQGLTVCPQGHVYESNLSTCPHPDHIPPPRITPPPVPLIQDSEEETAPPPRPPKKRLNAWLITADQRRNYQLYVDETKIGRSPTNDIILEGDRTVSRESAKIIEKNGLFRLHPSKPGRFPRINDYVVREPTLLEPDDEIQFGKDTILRFVKSR